MDRNYLKILRLWEIVVRFIVKLLFGVYDTIVRYVIAVQFTNKEGSFWLNPSKLLNIENSETLRDCGEVYYKNLLLCMIQLILQSNLQIKKGVFDWILRNYWISKILRLGNWVERYFKKLLYNHWYIITKINLKIKKEILDWIRMMDF